jgi:hypothetical protein
VGRRADRVAHVVQAIEHPDQVVALAREILGGGNLEAHAIGESGTLGASCASVTEGTW